MDHLAGLHIDDDQLFVVLAGNKQVLVFQIVGEVIDITFGGNRDRLHEPQKTRPMLHGRLLIDVRLGLLLRSRAQGEDRAHTHDDCQLFHFFLLESVSLLSSIKSTMIYQINFKAS